VQAAVRDTLLRRFERRLFLARWTDEIIQEMVRTLQDKLGRTVQESKYGRPILHYLRANGSSQPVSRRRRSRPALGHSRAAP
jgi:hypothetical protein